MNWRLVYVQVAEGFIVDDEEEQEESDDSQEVAVRRRKRKKVEECKFKTTPNFTTEAF